MWRANLEGSSLSEADFRAAKFAGSCVARGESGPVASGEKRNLVSADAQERNCWSGFPERGFVVCQPGRREADDGEFGRATLYAVNCGMPICCEQSCRMPICGT